MRKRTRKSLLRIQTLILGLSAAVYLADYFSTFTPGAPVLSHLASGMAHLSRQADRVILRLLIYGAVFVCLQIAIFERRLRSGRRILLLCLAVALVTCGERSFVIIDRDATDTPKIEEYPGVTEDQLFMLGWAAMSNDQSYTASHYINKPRKKQAGVVRIGVFAGSMGVQLEKDPSGDEYSYPYLLQKRFEQSGISNVEVINFSVGGYSATQMFLLSQYLGRAYSLDCIIFAAGSVPSCRDTQFAQLREVSSSLPHARFIDEGGKWRIEPPAGSTRTEAMLLYHAFLTPWRYIRYDHGMPGFLRILLPKEMRLRENPFYYRTGTSSKDETLPLIDYFVNQMADEAKYVIATKGGERSGTTSHPNALSIVLQANNLMNAVTSFRAGHLTRLGHMMFADELFSLLMGEASPLFTKFLISPPEKIKSHDRGKSLSSYEDVFIAHKSTLVASFAKANCFSRCAPYFKAKKTASLLRLPFNEERFLALEKGLVDGAPVYLQFEAGGQQKRLKIGAVVAPLAAFGDLHLGLENGDLFEDAGNWHLEVSPSGFSFEARQPVTDMAISIGDDRILETDAKDSVGIKDFMQQKKENLFTIDGRPDLHIEEVDQKGTLDLVLADTDSTVRVPLYSYEVKELEGAPFEKPFCALFDDLRMSPRERTSAECLKSRERDARSTLSGSP